MLPTDHKVSTVEKYCGRCLKGTMSQMMAWIVAMMLPLTSCPISITAKSCATAQKAVPKVEGTTDVARSLWRPKQDEAAAATGW